MRKACARLPAPNQKRRRFCSLELERLEDRTLPSAYTRIADVDGFASDPDLNGTFDSVDTTRETARTRYIPCCNVGEERAIFEFSIMELFSTAQVVSAELKGYVRSIQYNNNQGGVDVTVYGYAGDGQVTPRTPAPRHSPSALWPIFLL